MVTRNWYIKPLLHKAPAWPLLKSVASPRPDQTFDACYPIECRPALIDIFTRTWVLFAASCKHKRIYSQSSPLRWKWEEDRLRGLRVCHLRCWRRSPMQPVRSPRSEPQESSEDKSMSGRLPKPANYYWMLLMLLFSLLLHSTSISKDPLFFINFGDCKKCRMYENTGINDL